MFPNPKQTPTLAPVSMAQIITKRCRWVIQISRIQIISIPAEGLVCHVCVSKKNLSVPFRSMTANG